METFDAEILKDASGRLTIVELPFQAREAFGKPKGTIFVKGTMNGTEYRSKLLSRGSGKFVMVLDKAMQKSAGFDGKTTLCAHFTMTSDDLQDEAGSDREPDLLTCDMDVLTAIKTRQSIRKFTTRPIKEKSLRTILSAGLSAPTAKNKRPYHFIVIQNREILTLLARHNPNAPMLESAACAIVVCGDKNREGMREFLYSDCAAATQNMLLCIHGLGLGGVWCGVAAHSDWQKLIIDRLALPPKSEPISVIALGYPNETKALRPQWDPKKIHYDKW